MKWQMAGSIAVKGIVVLIHKQAIGPSRTDRDEQSLCHFDTSEDSARDQHTCDRTCLASLCSKILDLRVRLQSHVLSSLFLLSYRHTLSVASAVLILALSGCAFQQRPLAIMFRNAPADWTPPHGFDGCHQRDEVVLENGKPEGQPTIRMECPHRTALVDKRTKKIVWQTYW
jgi:hypothetical protein